MENRVNLTVFALLVAFGSLLAAGIPFQTYDSGQYAYNSANLYARQNYYPPGYFQKQTILVVSGDAPYAYAGVYSYYNYLPARPTFYPLPTPFPTTTPNCRFDSDCVSGYYCQTNTGNCLPRPTPSPTPTIARPCLDGTPAGECSVYKPKFCNANSQLIERASVCGCPRDYTVSGEGCIAPTPTPAATPFARPSPTPIVFITPTPSATATPAPTPEPDRISRLFYFKVSRENGFEQKYFAAQKGDVVNFRVTTDELNLGHSITVQGYGIDLLIASTNNSAPDNAVFVANKSGTFTVTCGHCNALNYPSGLSKFIGTLVVNN